jgi:hypothetical protein
MKIEQLLIHRKQRFTLYALCIWHEEVTISVGLRAITVEKISLIISNLHGRNINKIICSLNQLVC